MQFNQKLSGKVNVISLVLMFLATLFLVLVIYKI